MDLTFSAEERAFEQEVRDFIAANLPAEMKHAQSLTPSVFSDPDIGIAWQKSLHKKGWGAPGWPVDHGGPDWTSAQRWIFEAECARAGVPNVNVMGVKMVGPVIIGFGSPEQKNFYLPRILSGDDYWCQGYSEPGSGSDLASLKTRAVRDGDDYIVNGTKIWTTHAHHANRMFALVRTNDTERQQDGISFILIDMKSPGITTRPILTIGGDHEVNQVFFDDVRVPVANRVGEEGKGWTYGKYLLEFERGSGIASAKLRDALQDRFRPRRIRRHRPRHRRSRYFDADVRDRGRHRYPRDDRTQGAICAADRTESRRGVIAVEAARQRNPPGRDPARRRGDRQ